MKHEERRKLIADWFKAADVTIQPAGHGSVLLCLERKGDKPRDPPPRQPIDGQTFSFCIIDDPMETPE